MNISMGIYRLAQVIKWTSRVLGVPLLLFNTYALIVESVERNHLGRNLPSGFELEANGGDAIAVLVVTVVCMAVAEGIAWILEGFASDKHQ
jgi:hypothetical protein